MRFLFLAILVVGFAIAASAQNYGTGSNPNVDNDNVVKLKESIQKLHEKLPFVINDRVDITDVKYEGDAIITTYSIKFEISKSNKAEILGGIEKDVRNNACKPNKGDDLKMKFKRIYEYYSTYNSERLYIGSITINPCDTASR